MNRLLLTILATLSGCGPQQLLISGTNDGGAGAGKDGGTGTGGGTGGTGGGTASGGGAGTGGGFASNSFHATCSGVATSLAGTVFAPNGTDPVSGAEVSVYAAAPAPLAHGLFCENCDTLPAEVPLATTTAGPDGKFTLSLDAVPRQGSYLVTLRKARFRRVLPAVTLTPCGETRLALTQSSLPGKSVDGDLPRIAISSGTRDHLEKVVTAMGITEFDCVKGLPAGSTSESCTTGQTLGSLLANPTTLAQYAMLFIACAPAHTFVPLPTDAAATNLRDWVSRGGKLVVTDDSYDFVEQVFPDAITFAGTTAAAGVAQPLYTGELGLSAATLTGTVNDPTLVAWLSLFPGAISGSNVTLKGFLSRWGVQKTVAPGTRVIVHGPASFTGGMADLPLTSQFEVNHCGRVIYSSYHTDSGSGSLLPQERILEYLMLEVGTCVTIN